MPDTGLGVASASAANVPNGLYCGMELGGRCATLIFIFRCVFCGSDYFTNHNKYFAIITIIILQHQPLIDIMIVTNKWLMTGDVESVWLCNDWCLVWSSTC